MAYGLQHVLDPGNGVCLPFPGPVASLAPEPVPSTPIRRGMTGKPRAAVTPG